MRRIWRDESQLFDKEYKMDGEGTIPYISRCEKERERNVTQETSGVNPHPRSFCMEQLRDPGVCTVLIFLDLIFYFES
jgi:hypothetical protein